MLEKETRIFFDALRVPIYFILSLWVIHIVKLGFNISLAGYGVFPRAVDGLKGILFSPLIHGDFTHLISNSIPLFVLTFLIFFFYRKIAASSFTLIYLLSGFAVWLFGRSVYHIGASGVVYGLVSFVFWTGIFRRNIKSIILALIVTILYSSLFLGVLPNQEGISWESHLLGAIIGIIVAFIFRGTIEENEKPKPDPWLEDGKSEQFLLDRDVFETSKWDKIQEKQKRFY